MKHIIPILVILLLLSSGFVGVSNTTEEMEQTTTTVSKGPMDSAWPMFGHDARHTGRSPYSTENNPNVIKWIFEADWMFDTCPSIDDNGTIYIASWNNLYAIYSNGTEKWRWKGDFESSSPALAEDGTIYIGSNDKKLYAFYTNGTLKWSFIVDYNIKGAPIIGEDGTIYFTVWSGLYDNQGLFFAVSPNGTEKWHYKADFYVQSSPAIGHDGTIYFASHVYLYSFNPNGTLNWNKKIGDQNFVFLGSPTIGDDGTIYIPRGPGPLYAINPNGTTKWTCDIAWGSCKTPVIDKDGTIYIGDNRFHAIYPNGTKKWVYTPDGNQWHEIDSKTYAISDDGTIYIGTKDEDGNGYLIALDYNGTELWRQWIHNERVLSAPIIAPDGTVYIGVHLEASGYPYGRLYAFGELDSNAPDTPTVDGPTSGKSGIEYEYNFTTTDPNGDDVYYYIEWDDGSKENWIGPYGSGEEITRAHTWNYKGTYTIKARAKDTDNLWGAWGELEVTMPMNQQTSNMWFLQFLQNHPRMFLILRQLLSFIK